MLGYFWNYYLSMEDIHWMWVAQFYMLGFMAGQKWEMRKPLSSWEAAITLLWILIHWGVSKEDIEKAKQALATPPLGDSVPPSVDLLPKASLNSNAFPLEHFLCLPSFFLFFYYLFLSLSYSFYSVTFLPLSLPFSYVISMREIGSGMNFMKLKL